MQLKLVDTKEAADMLGMAPGTLLNQRCRGEGPPFVRMGRTIRYRVAELEEYVTARAAGR